VRQGKQTRRLERKTLQKERMKCLFGLQRDLFRFNREKNSSFAIMQNPQVTSSDGN